MSVGFVSPPEVKRYPFNPGIVRAPGMGIRYLPDHFINQGCTGFWPLNDGAGRSGITELANPGGLDTSVIGDGGGWAEGDGRIASTVWDGEDYPTQGFIGSSGVGVAGHAMGDEVNNFPFTCTGWAKFQTGEDRATIASRAHKSVNGTELEWLFGNDSSDRLSIFIYDLSGSERIGRRQTTTLASQGLYDSWHHYAFTYDGSGSSSGVKLFIDGVRVDNANNNSGGSYVAPHFYPARTTDIGCRFPADTTEGGGLEDAINGQICNVRIWQRELSEADIKLLYADPWIGTSHHASRPIFFTPNIDRKVFRGVSLGSRTWNRTGERWDYTHPINRECVALIAMDEGWTDPNPVLDYSPYRRSLSYSGTLESTKALGHGYNSFMRNFNGTSNEILLDKQPLPYGTQARSYSFWIFPHASATGNDRRILSATATPGTGGNYVIAYEDNAISVGIGSSRVITTKGIMSVLTKPYHVVITLPSGGDNEDHKIAIDGVQYPLTLEAGASNLGVDTAWGSQTNYRIGSDASGSGFHYDGGLGLFRIWNRELTDDEMLSLYLRPYIGIDSPHNVTLFTPKVVEAPAPTPEPAIQVINRVPNKITDVRSIVHRPDRSHKINQNLEYWFPAREGAGGVTRDIVRGFELFAEGDATWSDQELGRVVEFPAQGGYQAATVPPSAPGLHSEQGPLTWSCWARCDSTGTGRMFNWGENNTNFTTFWWQGNQAGITIRQPGLHAGRSTTADGASDAVADGTWKHLVGTYDGSGGSAGLRFYVNGVEQTTFRTRNVTGSRFGFSDNDAAYDFDGAVSNVRIWSRTLADDEIQTIYHDPWIGGESGIASFQVAELPEPTPTPTTSVFIPNRKPVNRVSRWGTQLDFSDKINDGIQGVYRVGRLGTGATNLVPWNGDLTQAGNPFGNRHDNLVGQYDAFNGTDSYIGSFDVSGWSQVTMACWVRNPDDESAGARAMSLFHSGGDDIRVWFPNNSDAHFAVDDGTAYQALFAASADWEDGVWHLYVGTFDGNEVKAYFDGKLANTTGSASFNFATADGAFRIGRSATASGDPITADIAIPRVWSRALAADEVMRLYTDPFAGFESIHPVNFFTTEDTPDPAPTFNVFYLAAILGGRIL